MREMKDSGIEWLGAIPGHWQTITISQLADQTKTPNGGMKETNLLSLSYGKIKRRDIDATEGLLPASFEGYNIVEPNDIVLRFTDLQNDQKSLRVGRVTEKGIITSAYTTIRPSNAEDSEYLYYCLHSYDLRKGFYGMGAGVRQGLKWQEAKYIEIPWPSLEERRRITSTLDEQCEKIDSAIEAARRSIEEYKAYKQSVIFEVVTSGLNSKAPMKDSGIEWIGEVPHTWEVRRGKNVYWPLQRKTAEDDEIITCFRDGEVTLRRNRREDGYTTALKEMGYQGIEPNDLVVHGMDGFAGSIGISDSRGKASPVLNVLDSNADKKYLMYYLRSLAYKEVFSSLATGIRVRSCNLNWPKLAEIEILLPPIMDQKNIASFLDSKSKKIDSAIEAKRVIIEELKAYKKSLIYEVVTGKRGIDGR